jgi:hypothetical protein
MEMQKGTVGLHKGGRPKTRILDKAGIDKNLAYLAHTLARMRCPFPMASQTLWRIHW